MKNHLLRILPAALMALVFSLTATSWAADTETVLFNFQGGAYGKYPESIVRDANGNFYGTLTIGGNPTCHINCGLVYKLSPSNGHMMESFVHVFTGGDDGAQPISLC